MPWVQNCIFSSCFTPKVAVWLSTSRWQQDPQQRKRPLPRAPCVAVGKMEGGINVEHAQEVIRSNTKLAPSFPQQLFAGSSVIVFYSLLTQSKSIILICQQVLPPTSSLGSASAAPSCLCGPHSPHCASTQMLSSLNYSLSFLLQI